MTQHPLDIAFQGIKLLAPNCIKKKKTKNLGSKSLTFLLHPIVSRNTKSGFGNQCFLVAPKLHIRRLIKSGLQNQFFSCISSFSICLLLAAMEQTRQPEKELKAALFYAALVLQSSTRGCQELTAMFLHGRSVVLSLQKCHCSSHVDFLQPNLLACILVEKNQFTPVFHKTITPGPSAIHPSCLPCKTLCTTNSKHSIHLQMPLRMGACLHEISCQFSCKCH